MTRHIGWTRTLNEEDALALLDTAQPGEAVADFEARALAELPQVRRPRRVETIRMVRDRLLDHRDGRISDGAFLRLMKSGASPRRTALLWGRFVYPMPLVHDTLSQVIAPWLAAADDPRSPPGAGRATREDWDAALRGLLNPEVTPATLDKTRSTLQTLFARAGILTFDAVPPGRPRTTQVHHGRPDPLAFAWLVGHELRTSGRGEITERAAASESFAARLFLPLPAYAAQCLEAGAQAGVLVSSHLMGMPRYLLPVE
jgi:hypothetical protein